MVSFLESLFIGNEREAARLNQKNVDDSLGFIGGVNVPGLFGQARGQITGQARGDILSGYQQAIAQVGAAGTGAQLEATRAADQARGGNRQDLASRGLFSSSLAQSADRGVSSDLTRAQSNISSNVAGAQGGLMAGRGQALAQESRSREGATAGLFGQQAQMLLRQAMAKANVLGQVQNVGTPGILGGMVGQATGAFGAAAGKGLAGLLLKK